MKKNISISVVIPTYRRCALLMECLHALALQRFNAGDFEVIVVSDGPDADTRKVVYSWKATGLLQLKYLHLPVKAGPAAARNMGWKSAAGKLIAFTDDDCRPDPEWLNRLWDNHRNDDAPLAAYTGKVTVPLPALEAPTDHACNTARLAAASFITANCACTKAALSLTGGFDERFSMAWREDSDLEFKFIKRGIPVRYLPVARVVHPVRYAAWGSSLKDQRKGAFNALLHRKYPHLYKTRINQAPPPGYYLMIISLTAGIFCLFTHHTAAARILLFTWTLAWLHFSYKRLEHTSHRMPHIFEMLCTSAVIPFLSVYWHFYGMIRYRTFFM